MITVAGCGRMGGPMLDALRKAGFDARGFDVRAMDASYITDDVSALRRDTQTLITVVRDTAQTDAVLFGAQNFCAGPALRRIILCSTLSPRYVLDLRARVPESITLIDAPMSGAQIAAQHARLSFMLGGNDADLDAKVLNNLLAAPNTAMTRLVLDWADQAGLDEEKLLQLIHTSSGQNWFASGFNEIEFARDGLSTDNTIAILVKDVASALDAAPAGADLTLPKTVQDQIRSLKPRL